MRVRLTLLFMSVTVVGFVAASVLAAESRVNDGTTSEPGKLQGLWQTSPGGIEHRDGMQVVQNPVPDGRAEESYLQHGIHRFPDAAVLDRGSALLYCAELAVRLERQKVAVAALSAVRELKFSDSERHGLADDVAHTTPLDSFSKRRLQHPTDRNRGFPTLPMISPDASHGVDNPRSGPRGMCRTE